MEGAEINQAVFVRIGPRLIAVQSDRDVDLGRVDAKDQFLVSRRPGPTGMVYDVVVKRAESAESGIDRESGESVGGAKTGESAESR